MPPIDNRSSFPSKIPATTSVIADRLPLSASVKVAAGARVTAVWATFWPSVQVTELPVPAVAPLRSTAGASLTWVMVMVPFRVVED